MSGDTDRQSSSEVAHEAEDTRAHLASTLEQLRTNLKPENVMEEVVNNAKIGVSTVADSLVGVARQYPIPAVLLAAGSAFVMRFFNVSPAEPRPGTTRPATPRATFSTTSAPRPPMLRNPAAFTPASGEQFGTSLGAHVADARDGVAGSVRAGGATLKRYVNDAYDATSDQAGAAIQTVSRYIPGDRGQVRSKLATLLDEQPLILGVIGLAVGAAIGAALPMTETEDSLMGTTAHRLRETATEAARHEVDGLRAAAGDVIGTARHSASENLGGFVKDVGNSARAAVDKAGSSFTAADRDV